MGGCVFLLNNLFKNIPIGFFLFICSIMYSPASYSHQISNCIYIAIYIDYIFKEYCFSQSCNGMSLPVKPSFIYLKMKADHPFCYCHRQLFFKFFHNTISE